MRPLLIFLIVSLGFGQGQRSRYHDPRRSLVLFLDSNGTIPSEENYQCGGAFVTRQHVLTTLQCALWSKRHQLRPWRLHYFGTSMSSTEVVSGNSTFCQNHKIHPKTPIFLQHFGHFESWQNDHQRNARFLRNPNAFTFMRFIGIRFHTADGGLALYSIIHMKGYRIEFSCWKWCTVLTCRNWTWKRPKSCSDYNRTE